jgi:hypothetical protein
LALPHRRDHVRQPAAKKLAAIEKIVGAFLSIE